MAPSQRKIVKSTSTSIFQDIHLARSLSSSPTSSATSLDPRPPNSVTSGTINDNANAPKKKGRGIAIGYEVKKRARDGNKISGIIIDEEKNLPVGPAEKLFKMEIGIITRLLAPMGLFYWHGIPEEKKEPIFAQLQSEFEIDLSDKRTKDMVDEIMGNRFRQYKHRLRGYYQKYSSPSEARRHPPCNVGQSDWEALCEHFESDKFKRASEANIKNRRRLEINHSTGSKSRCQRMFEMEQNLLVENEKEGNEAEEEIMEIEKNIDEEPLELKVFYETHRKKDGTWIHPKAQENYDKMITLWKQSRENDNLELTGKEIFERILERKIGYLGSSSSSVASIKSAEQLKALESERQARQALEEKVQSQQSVIDDMLKSQNHLQEMVKILLAQSRAAGNTTDGI